MEDYSQKMDSPNSILESTAEHHNELIVATRPGVNVHPGYGATAPVKIAAIFLVDYEEPAANLHEGARAMGAEVLGKQEVEDLFLSHARQVANEWNVPVLYLPGKADGPEYRYKQTA